MANYYNTISCENCGNHEFIKKGKTENGSKMILRCKNCGKTMRVEYDKDSNLPLSEVQAMEKVVEEAIVEEYEQELATTAYNTENDIAEDCAEEVVENNTSEEVATAEYATLFDQDGKQMKVGNLSKEELIQFANQANLSIICVDEKKQYYRVEPKVNHTKGANIYNTVDCPSCGQHEFIKKGKAVSKNSTKINLMCKNCGKRFAVAMDEASGLPLSEIRATATTVSSTFNENITTTIAEEVNENIPNSYSSSMNDENVIVTATNETQETVQVAEFATLFDQDGKQMKVGNLTKEELIQFANQANLSIICVDEQKQFYRVEPKVNHTKG